MIHGRDAGCATDARRALVAVLFTDLVGSTELMSNLGQRTFDDFRRRHFSALGTVVSAYGGHEVKNTGDGLLAVFPSGAQAVDAAVALQRAAVRTGGSAPTAIRVGLAVGDATLEAGDVFGAPVVLAARLVAVAGPGQILASAVVRVAASGWTDARFVDLGSVDLKGLPGPVPACEILWDPLPGPSIPVPGLLCGNAAVFVGREPELEKLSELWSQVVTGQLRLTLLGGEPGVGKTRLAARFAGRLQVDGALVLGGRCDEDLGVPYQPFVEALRHFIEHCPPEELPTSLGRHAGELLRLAPELADRVPHLAPPLSSDPETERYRLFDAVATWLGEASARTPGLLVLDDLHWAAKPTLLLLRHILRFHGNLPVLVVATYRDSEVGRGHPLSDLLADARRLDGVERITMTGLDQTEVAAFIDAVADGPSQTVGDGDFPRALWSETQGNPFFVTEVLRHLIESGALELQDGRWATTAALGDLGIPEGVRDVVGRRLSRLSDDANRVLATASVVGLEFEADLLERASGFAAEVVLDALEEAVASRLVVEIPGPRPRSSFAHALVRTTLYDELTQARRMTLHRRVAEAIETLHAERLEDHLPALAHHFSRAGDDPSTIIRYAVRAGERAMAQLAFEAAATYYEEALSASERVPDGDASQAAHILLALGTARARSGDARTKDAYLCAAELGRQDGNPEILAGAALGMADLWSFSGTVDDTKLSLLEEAKEALGDTISSITAGVLARLATELYGMPGSWDRRAALSSRSIEVARRVGDPVTLALSLHARNHAMWGPLGAAERLALGREIVELAHQGGDRELALHGHAWCQTGLLELGDVAGLEAALAGYECLAEELRQPRYRWYATSRRAMRSLLAGDLDEGERLARQARGLGIESCEPDAENVFGAQMYAVWLERPCPEAIEILDGVCNSAEAALPADSALVLGFRLMRLLIILETNNGDEVRAELDGLLGYAVGKLDPSFYGMGWGILAVLLSTAAERLSNAEAAASLYELLLPCAGLNAVNCGAVTFNGAYSHHLGVLAATLGRWGEAEQHLADAASVHERMGARVFLCRTRLEWARTLLSRRHPGDAERAQALLDDAQNAARVLGLEMLAREAGALLPPDD